jgi:hypothetical protein
VSGESALPLPPGFPTTPWAPCEPLSPFPECDVRWGRSGACNLSIGGWFFSSRAPTRDDSRLLCCPVCCPRLCSAPGCYEPGPGETARWRTKGWNQGSGGRPRGLVGDRFLPPRPPMITAPGLPRPPLRLPSECACRSRVAHRRPASSAGGARSNAARTSLAIGTCDLSPFCESRLTAELVHEYCLNCDDQGADIRRAFAWRAETGFR